MNHNLKNIFDFIIEIEKLKMINRKIKKIGSQKYENSAEHSWQIALLAILLEKYSDKKINIYNIVKMLLIHDLGEVDTGDKHLYTESHNNPEEKKCVERLFKILPDEMNKEFMNSWLEFDEQKTDDAKYANAIDRLMPLLQNLYNNGQSWVENNTTLEQIFSKNKSIIHLNESLWNDIEAEINNMNIANLFNEKI